MITIRFNRRSMHSLIVLWGNWVMRNVGNAQSELP
jgi:hypothetical protein